MINEALNTSIFAALFAAGALAIGHAKYKARIAAEQWSEAGGPEVLAAFQLYLDLGESARTTLHDARFAMQRARLQVEAEVA